MKALVALLLMMTSLASYAASQSADDDWDKVVDAKLNEMGVSEPEAPVKKDPASGFWTCNGIRLHMGVDLASWQNLDDGDLYTELDPPAPEDGKEVKVRGTTYTFSSMRNPAVIKFFVVDTTGKKLYLHDDIKFFKLHPCKRDN